MVGVLLRVSTFSEKLCSDKILPGLSVPPSLAKLAFVPKALDDVDLRRLGFRYEYGDDIVTMFHVLQSEYPSINPCSPRDLPLFAKTYIRQQWCKFRRTPRLYLYETKHVAVESDQVDLARYLHAPRVSADRHLEIRSHNPVSVPHQVLSGHLLTQIPKPP